MSSSLDPPNWPPIEGSNPSQNLLWVERLRPDELIAWLRACVWGRNPHPVLIPIASRLAIEISELFKKGSPELKTRVRTIVPILLQEWGRDDLSEALDDLLVICGRLRCATAEPVIMQITNERLVGRAAEIFLRQRCLSVLSGFGCTDRSKFVFLKYIDNCEYAAICYRALYRFDLRYAAAELSEIFRVFKAAGALDDLGIAVRRLFNDVTSSNQRMDTLTQFLAKGDPATFFEVLHLIKGIGILNYDLFRSARFDNRREFFKTLLTQTSLHDLDQILWDLKSIGIELHFVEFVGENLVCAYENPTTKEVYSEPILSTDDFSDELVATIQASNEEVATAWLAVGGGGFDLN